MMAPEKENNSFKAKNGSVSVQTSLLRTNQISGITCKFKMYVKMMKSGYRNDELT